jgi:uncharacterized protein (TIGR02118 family)
MGSRGCLWAAGGAGFATKSFWIDSSGLSWWQTNILIKKYLKLIHMTTKINFFSIIFAIIGLMSCKTSQLKHSSTTEIGMFKVEILYPNGEDKTFDMEYYEKKHMPMVAGFLGKNLKFYEIDKGLAGRTSTDKVPFVAIGYFYIHDVAEYNTAIAQNRDAVISDFKNYTNIQPVVQISEIKQVGYLDTK